MVCVDIKKKLKPKLVIVIFERFRILRMFHVKQKKLKRLRDTVLKIEEVKCTI